MALLRAIACATALVPAVSAGCSTIEGCDAAGCGSGVRLDAPGIRTPSGEFVTLRACVDGVCGEQRTRFDGRVLGGHVDVGMPRHSDDVAVSVTITDDAGNELAHASGTARVTVEYPNGEDCPPSCPVVHVRLADDRLMDAA